MMIFFFFLQIIMIKELFLIISKILKNQQSGESTQKQEPNNTSLNQCYMGIRICYRYLLIRTWVQDQDQFKLGSKTKTNQIVTLSTWHHFKGKTNGSGLKKDLQGELMSKLGSKVVHCFCLFLFFIIFLNIYI
jgi:hypothetical protein